MATVAERPLEDGSSDTFFTHNLVQRLQLPSLSLQQLRFSHFGRQIRQMLQQ